MMMMMSSYEFLRDLEWSCDQEGEGGGLVNGIQNVSEPTYSKTGIVFPSSVCIVAS